ncbi:MAG: hypothetical protein COB67_00565 [SAR324 cluster bacterium]|uniref:Uncharacterized protein n=1 Tax=SAR324 cluster bacterium TaxID=2024889 RepID=A0A2A4TCE1_9DELT|nr:MAG: hypothetical protein COB67_00565 [SAR324 cluster bacterium]
MEFLGWSTLLFLVKYKIVAYLYVFIISVATLFVAFKTDMESYERATMGGIAFVSAAISPPLAVFLMMSLIQLIDLFGGVLFSGSKW